MRILLYYRVLCVLSLESLELRSLGLMRAGEDDSRDNFSVNGVASGVSQSGTCMRFRVVFNIGTILPLRIARLWGRS